VEALHEAPQPLQAFPGQCGVKIQVERWLDRLSAFVVLDQDGCVRATHDAFCTTVATGWLDVRGILWVDFNDGARVTDQAGVTRIAILAEIPVDDR
jgi:hypothetical protein